MMHIKYGYQKMTLDFFSALIHIEVVSYTFYYCFKSLITKDYKVFATDKVCFKKGIDNVKFESNLNNSQIVIRVNSMFLLFSFIDL